MKLSKEEYLESKKIFDEEGYIVFQNVLNKGEIEAYFRALDPYLTKDVKGRNNFEGLKTNRIYALLNLSLIHI